VGKAVGTGRFGWLTTRVEMGTKERRFNCQAALGLGFVEPIGAGVMDDGTIWAFNWETPPIKITKVQSKKFFCSMIVVIRRLSMFNIFLKPTFP
jgi:hypothetical protein